MTPRILKNAADSSPGNGTAPAPDATANPQAQGDGPPIVAADIQSAITKAVRDAINADARRAAAPAKSTKPAETAPAAPAFDPVKLRELDRAVTRAGHAESIDSAAYKRLERAYVDEAPDDAEGWVAGYFGGLGVVRRTAATAAQAATSTITTAAPAATQPHNVQPASDRGAPPAPKVPLEDRPLMEMSQADRDAYIALKGRNVYHQTLMSQLRGKPVKLR